MRKLFFIFLFVPFFAKAQYVADAPLTSVDKEGFYQIPLPPRVTALLEFDLRNLRVLDDADAEVPYVEIIEKPNNNIIEWKRFKMERELKYDCCTIVTLFNEDKKSINNFLLEIKNAAVVKHGVLRGSDDGTTWYALRESVELPIGDFRDKKVAQVLDFPLSDYSYYRLTLDDSTSSPLNIVGAWLTTENVMEGLVVRVPSIKFTQKDTLNGRYTWVTIHSDTSQYINRLEFDIEGPRFYKRSVTLFQKEHGTETFDVISGQRPVAYVFTKGKDIKLRIENENNPPLKFKDIRAYQLKQSIVAYLAAGKNYRIAIGADSLQSPVYDLGFFKDSIPANPTEIQIGRLKKRDREEVKAKTSPTFFRDPKLIWAAIILVIIVLAGMTVRMLREQQEEKD